MLVRIGIRKMMKITHVINRDKFTKGYIEFMKLYMDEYCHCFIVENRREKLAIKNQEKIYYIDNFSIISIELLDLLEESDLVIISGVFNSIQLLIKLPNLIRKKTLLHFWGGDFYYYNRKAGIFDLHFILSKYRRRYYFKKCAGFIFLIEGEYEEFKKIFGLKKRYFIAPMPPDINRKNIILKNRKNVKKTDEVKILLGNSATATNHHKEIIDWLSVHKNHNMKIYVPLSYGDDTYRQKIISYGKEKLGKKFYPLTEFMSQERYIQFLSSIDIGVFNNDRQQAMGNILILLALGKKVYLRTDTPMWNRFVSDGYMIYPIQDNQNMDYDEFTSFSMEEGIQNQKIFDAIENIEKPINKWTKIFETFETRKDR